MGSQNVIPAEVYAITALRERTFAQRGFQFLGIPNGAELAATSKLF
jgi:hypothetical protein